MATQTLTTVLLQKLQKQSETDISWSTSHALISDSEPLPAVRHKDALALQQAYTTRRMFLKVYNPDLLQKIGSMPKERIFLGRAPEFSIIREAYGEQTVLCIIEIYIYQLAEFSGAKDKLTPQISTQLAATIADQFSFLKISEFCYFISRMMAGFYERFYGKVDPMVVTMSLQQFCKDRELVLTSLINEQRRRALELEMQQPRKTCSWDEFVKMRERGEIE